MRKIITLYDTSEITLYDSRASVLSKNLIRLIQRRLPSKEDVDFRRIRQELPAKELKESNAIIWAPHPRQLINFLPQKVSLVENTWFKRLKEQGYQGKRILYLSTGFRGETPSNQVDFSKIAEHTVFYPSSTREDIKELAGIIEGLN